MMQGYHCERQLKIKPHGMLLLPMPAAVQLAVALEMPLHPAGYILQLLQSWSH